MPRPFYAVIIPLGEGPVDPGYGRPGGRPGGGYRPDQGFNPAYPDQGLPGEGESGGEYPDQGLPGGGEYPDQGLPGRPPHVGNRPPGSRPGRPIDPGFGWGGGERPGNRPPGSRPPRPDQGLPPELANPPIGPTHPWIPPEGETLPPPPDDIADQVVVAVWRPQEQQWKVAVAEGPHPEQQE